MSTDDECHVMWPYPYTIDNRASPLDPPLSPCCQATLQYMINRDLYACQKCKKEYDVLSVERDHVAYTGGPPVEIPK